MDPSVILLRYGEIFLKGKNQRQFTAKLIKNIKAITGVDRVVESRGRFLVEYFAQHHLLRQVFGLTSYSVAYAVPKEMMAIKKQAKVLLAGRTGRFKVNTKRADKKFPIKSPDVSHEVGRYCEREDLKYDYRKPEFEVNVEINQKGAYVFLEAVRCFGGLPTGVEGQVAVLVENERSLLAGLYMMKRGVSIFPIGPKGTDISLLQKFSPVSLLVQRGNKNALVEVSGDTLEVFQRREGVVLRPLIAMSEKEISKELASFQSVLSK